MKIIVLVKQVPDTYGQRRLDIASGLLDREGGDSVLDEINERALEVALRCKDADRSTEVILLSMGPESAKEALLKGLSMGADSAVHIVDDALVGADAAHTARVLAVALKDQSFDIVIAGNESTDGRGGVVPAMIAEHLGLPLLSSLTEVEIAGSQVAGLRSGDDGTMRAHAFLPAIISIAERAAEARFPNFKGLMTAKRKPYKFVSTRDVSGTADWPSRARTVVLSTDVRPTKIAGTKIVDDGNAANELAEFLVTRRFI